MKNSKHLKENRKYLQRTFLFLCSKFHIPFKKIDATYMSDCPVCDCYYVATCDVLNLCSYLPSSNTTCSFNATTQGVCSCRNQYCECLGTTTLAPPNVGYETGAVTVFVITSVILIALIIVLAIFFHERKFPKYLYRHGHEHDHDPTKSTEMAQKN